MKVVKIFIILIAIISFFNPYTSIANNNQQNNEQIEISYINGLTSGISGIRISSAYHLGELKSKGAVSSLIHMLHYDKSTAGMIMAAISLVKIGDHAGIQEIRKVREFIPQGEASYDAYINHLSNLWDEYLQNNPKDAIALKNIPIAH